MSATETTSQTGSTRSNGPGKRRRGADTARLLGLAAFAFGLSAVTSAPASLWRPALDAAGGRVTYERLDGTIWRGRAKRVVVDGTALGDIDFALNPAMLALGRASMRARVDGYAARATARIELNAIDRSARVREAAGVFNLASVRRYKLLGAPFSGSVKFRIDDLRWRDGKGCLTAAGEIWTDMLSAQTQGLGLGEAALHGPIACIGDDLRISLAGANAMGSAFVNIDVRPDRTYSLSATVDADRFELRQALELVGFRREAAGLVYDAYGPIKGLGS
ncbi:MAG: type II secretion system protein N [Pseudomonadota bacterium]